MSIIDDLLISVHTLILALSDATDEKIVAAGNLTKGPQPALPFLTIRITTPGGGAHGPSERINGLSVGLTPTAKMRERREGTVSIQGYGPTSFEWLDQVQARLASPEAIALYPSLGFSAILLTPAQDISALLDTREQRRSSLELTLRYQHTTAPTDQVELLRTEVGLTFERFPGDPDIFTADFALDEDGAITAP